MSENVIDDVTAGVTSGVGELLDWVNRLSMDELSLVVMWGANKFAPEDLQARRAVMRTLGLEERARLMLLNSRVSLTERWKQHYAWEGMPESPAGAHGLVYAGISYHLAAPEVRGEVAGTLEKLAAMHQLSEGYRSASEKGREALSALAREWSGSAAELLDTVEML